MIPTPHDFDSLQAWLDGIAGNHGYLPAGDWTYSDDLYIHRQTRIEGAGKDVAVLRSTNPQASIRNADGASGVAVEHVGFAGDADADVAGIDNFICLIGAEDWSFTDCVFRDRRLDLIVLAECFGVLFERCQFRNFGTRKPPAVPGSGQYVGGCAIFAWRDNSELSVINCTVEDGGGGFWLGNAPRSIATGNRISDVVEFAIAGLGLYSIAHSNILGRVHTVDVSGSHLESGGEAWLWVNNICFDSDHSPVYMFNPRRVIVGHNLVIRPNRAQAANTSGITVSSWAPSAGVGDKTPECVLVSGNVVCDENGNSTHAIHVADMGGGVVSDVSILDNITGPSEQWQDGAIQAPRKGVLLAHN